jgi:hypothetical protein
MMFGIIVSWMRAEAEKKIGHPYPKAKLKDGKADALVIAWLLVCNLAEAPCG